MSAARSRKTFYGWHVVAAVFVLATFGWGLSFFGPPVYLHTVQVARGWSLALISAAVTTHFLFGALVVANLPKLYKRFGVSAVTKAGCVALAAGIFGWAMAEQPWQLFLATLFSGGGWATMGRSGRECDHFALVRQIAPRGACLGVQWRHRRRRDLLSSLGRGNRPAWVPGRGACHRSRHDRDNLGARGSLLREDLFAAAAAIQGAAIAAFMLGRVRIGERKGKVAPEIDTSVHAETKLSER